MPRGVAATFPQLPMFVAETLSCRCPMFGAECHDGRRERGIVAHSRPMSRRSRWGRSRVLPPSGLSPPRSKNGRKSCPRFGRVTGGQTCADAVARGAGAAHRSHQHREAVVKHKEVALLAEVESAAQRTAGGHQLHRQGARPAGVSRTCA